MTISPPNSGVATIVFILRRRRSWRTLLLDHLVGGGEGGWGDHEPGRRGGSMVAHELEAGRLLEGKTAGGRAGGEAIYIVRRPPMRRREVGSIRDESAHEDE